MLLQKAIEASQKESGVVNPDRMTYEQMLELGEKLGKVDRGFTQMEIQAIPSVKITTSHLMNVYKGKSCVICCDPFEVGNCLKKLNCKHEYHDGCIDPWLEKEKNCPVCKQEVDIE